MAWVYMLRCCDNSFYVGLTIDLAGRIEDYRAGKGGVYTSHRLPVVLVHSEEFPDIRAAAERERQIKGWTRRKKQALACGELDELRRLAKRTPPKV